MAITVIKGPDGIRTVLTAVEDITQSKAVIAAGDKETMTAADLNESEVIGLAAATTTSGQLARVLVKGVQSGVVCAEAVNCGQAVQAGTGASGAVSGQTGLVRALTSGVGAMLGRALNSGGFGSGIPLLVDLG